MQTHRAYFLGVTTKMRPWEQRLTLPQLLQEGVWFSLAGSDGPVLAQDPAPGPVG